jgi:hypothetical protein
MKQQQQQQQQQQQEELHCYTMLGFLLLLYPVLLHADPIPANQISRNKYCYCILFWCKLHFFLTTKHDETTTTAVQVAV